MIRTRYLLATAMLLVAAPALAQQAPQPRELDRILAVVGDSILLQSDVDVEILARLQGARQQPDPETLERMRPQVLQDKINEMLLLQAAIRDTTIIVLDRDVEPSVNKEIADIERNIGGPARLDIALRQQGLTRAELRAMKLAGYRRTAMIQQYLGKVRQKRRPPTVTEEEIRAYFEQNKGRLGDRPATISFRQVVLTATASDSAKAAARRRAEEALKAVKMGEDFVTVAKRFTEEPGGRERGGDLGWFRRGAMVPEFENVAFAMHPGQVSGIVESPFGFHIIKVEKVKAGEVQARHILFIPERTDADTERSRALADSVAQLARAGTPIDSLVGKFHDKSEQARVGPYPRDQLPQEYVTALRDAAPGQIVGPFDIPAADGGRKWAIVQVTDVQAAGEYTLDDASLHQQVREQVEQGKLIDEIIGELRRGSYVDVRI